MTELTRHKVNELNYSLKIESLDQYTYAITPTKGNAKGVRLDFQNGPVKDGIPNGLSNEALLAILEHRLESFQSGDFACIENELALSSVRNAMSALSLRTQGRMDRGVENTHEA